uniref:Uncharacterized protein n=1 Tax=viral metagenome TaxID=1070528 RepID=A0A6M3JR38_9ZZZZ
MSDKSRGHTPEENEAYSNFIGSHFDEVDMSNKAFEKFQKEYFDTDCVYVPHNRIAFVFWQESARQATADERKRIADILETRYHELAQLKTDDNSDACWEDYNYSQKEIARLLKSLK